MKKKILIFSVFNLSIIFYFLSLHEIKQGQDYKRLLKKEQLSQATQWPQGLELITPNQWGGQNSSEMLNEFRLWAKNAESLAPQRHKELFNNLIKSLENLSSSSEMLSIEMVSTKYTKSVESLNMLISSRRWQNLLKESEKIPFQFETAQGQQTQAILNQLTNSSLESNLSQQNKEKVLGQIALVESDLMQLNLLQEQFKSWQSSLDQGKKISRLVGAANSELIGKSPFESTHLLYSGALLFLIMNTWIALAKVETRKTSLAAQSLSLKENALEVLEQLTKIYRQKHKSKDVPFRVGKMQEGRVLLPKKMREVLAEDLYMLQQQMGSEGKVQFLYESDKPLLEVSFIGPASASQAKIDPTPFCFSTHKKLSSIGGAVEWEAQFDEEAQIRRVDFSYQLPEASQLSSSI